ncbi:MAG: hypothetical protein AAGA99_24965 [Actinomycetota bacterium]
MLDVHTPQEFDDGHLDRAARRHQVIAAREAASRAVIVPGRGGYGRRPWGND